MWRDQVKAMKMSKPFLAYLIIQITLGVIGVFMLAAAGVSTMKPKCTCARGVTPQSGTSCAGVADPTLKQCCQHYPDVVWVSGCPAGAAETTACSDLACFKHVSRKGALWVYILVGAALIAGPAVVYWPIWAVQRHKAHAQHASAQALSSTGPPPARASVVAQTPMSHGGMA